MELSTAPGRGKERVEPSKGEVAKLVALGQVRAGVKSGCRTHLNTSPVPTATSAICPIVELAAQHDSRRQPDLGEAALGALGLDSRGSVAVGLVATGAADYAGIEHPPCR